MTNGIAIQCCGKTKIDIIADEINPAGKTRDDSKSSIAQLGNASLAPSNALVRLASALSQVGPRSSAIHASVLASAINIIKTRVRPYWCYTRSEGRWLIATKQRGKREALSPLGQKVGQNKRVSITVSRIYRLR